GRGWDAENYVVFGKLLDEVRLRKSATHGIRSAGDGIQILDAAIRRAVGIPDEPCLAHRAAGGDERGNRIDSAIQVRERYLWVGNRVLRTGQARAAAADGRLGMAHRTAVPVECRP